MSPKLSNSNHVSFGRARIITTLVHIILLLLAILPLMALKPVAKEPKGENVVDKVEVNNQKAIRPVANLLK
ncbi:MAG TPA: hypothetical protein ENK75_01405 [Saprospiraceae bacterium]|nr:hypothetical protein [Saprospiraceae bacterium]